MSSSSATKSDQLPPEFKDMGSDARLGELHEYLKNDDSGAVKAFMMKYDLQATSKVSGTSVVADCGLWSLYVF